MAGISSVTLSDGTVIDVNIDLEAALEAAINKSYSQSQSNSVLWKTYGNIVVVQFNGYTVTASGDVKNFIPDGIKIPSSHSRAILINAQNTKFCSVLAKSNSRTFDFDPQEANKPYYGSLVYYSVD